MQITPLAAFTQTLAAQVDVLNVVGSDTYSQVVKVTPVGIGGQLQRSWVFTPATLANPVATIGTNSQYFLPLELGRKPGKGISSEGQESVTLWARRKLSLEPQDAKSLAFLLSRKYKLKGRPARGLIGLAKPGASAQPLPESPIPGSILDQGFKLLESQLAKI